MLLLVICKKDWEAIGQVGQSYRVLYQGWVVEEGLADCEYSFRDRY